MSSNLDQEKAFGREFLDNILEWIGSIMSPEDVFDEKKLSAWALAWAENQKEWISDPDDWALENGYVKDES